jgi:hypothetical protein
VRWTHRTCRSAWCGGLPPLWLGRAQVTGRAALKRSTGACCERCSEGGEWDGPHNSCALTGRHCREFLDRYGRLWHQDPASGLATRDDARTACLTLDEALLRLQARPQPLCPVREQLFLQAFDEVIRQVGVLSPERGLLLLRCRDQLRVTLAAYGSMAWGGVEYGANARSRLAHDHPVMDDEVMAPLDEGNDYPAIIIPDDSANSFASTPQDEDDDDDDVTGKAHEHHPTVERNRFREDDRALGADPWSELSDAELMEAVTKYMEEVRDAQLRVSELRLSLAGSADAWGRRRSRADEAFVTEADKLRTQNALLQSIVDQARRAREDISGVSLMGSAPAAAAEQEDAAES